MKQERQRRSAAERAEIIERWEQSGLNAREFADREGLKVPSLYMWRKQWTAAHDETQTAERKPAFSELHLSPAPLQSSHVEIVACNNRVVRVHGDISARRLQQVLAAVEQC